MVLLPTVEKQAITCVHGFGFPLQLIFSVCLRSFFWKCDSRCISSFLQKQRWKYWVIVEGVIVVITEKLNLWLQSVTCASFKSLYSSLEFFATELPSHLPGLCSWHCPVPPFLLPPIFKCSKTIEFLYFLFMSVCAPAAALGAGAVVGSSRSCSELIASPWLPSPYPVCICTAVGAKTLCNCWEKKILYLCNVMDLRLCFCQVCWKWLSETCLIFIFIIII